MHGRDMIGIFGSLTFSNSVVELERNDRTSPKMTVNSTSSPIPFRRSNVDSAVKSNTVIEPSKGLFHLDLAELWLYRELLYFMAWREIKIRYKQTVIGAAWAIVQPLLTMLIFTIVFGQFAKIPSDGLPYALFAYTALLPWEYFSQAISRSGGSLVNDANLIRKVYFPRLIIPLAAVVTPLVDICLSFTILLGMMAWFGFAPTLGVLMLPLFLLLAVVTALSVTLWLAPLNVRFRDVRYAIPFLIQVWMYASPIAYPVSLIPEQWRLVYSLNPLVGVIEGFRWALLGNESPDFTAIAVSTIAVLMFLSGGLIYFKRMEQTFADVI
jgi:lipopolysaccharide transport system permease protein